MENTTKQVSKQSEENNNFEKAKLDDVQHENDILQDEWKAVQEELDQLKAERKLLLNKLMRHKKYAYYYY